MIFGMPYFNANFSGYFNWGLALFSSVMSLVFSDFLKFAPCSLCWYQRIFMFSMVFVIATGILAKDSKIHLYSAVLSFFGGLVSIYHNLIYYEVISEGLKICSADLSCKAKTYELFGMISIPLMSLISFLIIFLFSLKGLKGIEK